MSPAHFRSAPFAAACVGLFLVPRIQTRLGALRASEGHACHCRRLLIFWRAGDPGPHVFTMHNSDMV